MTVMGEIWLHSRQETEEKVAIAKNTVTVVN